MGRKNKNKEKKVIPHKYKGPVAGTPSCYAAAQEVSKHVIHIIMI